MVSHSIIMMGRLTFIFCLVSVSHAYRCSVCSAGKYKSGIDHSLCLDCAENTYSATLGATTCVSCGTHSTAVRGSSTCVCDAGYAKSGESMDCSGCSDGLVSVNGKCECPSGSSGPSSGPCVLCPAGKFKTAVGSAACEDCPMHTYQTQTGARNCTSCPGELRSAAGSTSMDMCECGVGFLQRTDNTCEKLLSRFVEVRFEIQTTIDSTNLTQAQSVISDSIREAIIMDWTNKYNVSREYLIVEVVAIVESGRELLATYVRFEIVVRRIFPADTGIAYVDAVILAVSNFSVNNLEVQMPSSNSTVNGTYKPASTSKDFKFEIIGATTTSTQTVLGTLNLKLNVLVECLLIPWNDGGLGTSQACDIVCNAEQEKMAVAFIDGHYILSCVDRRLETTPVQTTPVQNPPEPLPIPDNPLTVWIPYFILIGVGVPFVLVTLICRLQNRKL